MCQQFNKWFSCLKRCKQRASAVRSTSQLFKVRHRLVTALSIFQLKLRLNSWVVPAKKGLTLVREYALVAAYSFALYRTIPAGKTHAVLDCGIPYTYQSHQVSLVLGSLPLMNCMLFRLDCNAIIQKHMNDAINLSKGVIRAPVCKQPPPPHRHICRHNKGGHIYKICRCRHILGKRYIQFCIFIFGCTCVLLKTLVSFLA